MDVAINYWAVLGAAVANIMVGMLWFGPLFGKKWKQLMGFSDEAMRSMPLTATQAMIGGLIASLIMSYVLAHSYAFASVFTNQFGWSAGAMAGFWNWVGYVAPVTVGMVLWEGKPWKLWILVAAHWLVSLLIMGAIIGAWS